MQLKLCLAAGSPSETHFSRFTLHPASCGVFISTSTGTTPMSCTRPIPAQQYVCEITGLPAILFKNFKGAPNLELPCNKCLSCKLRKAKEWAIRCWHESQMYDENSYITLTYSDEHLPAYADLDHRDFQLFMKRLRTNTGKKLSYFMCGEYGDQFHRPHYHLILFGWFPPDAKYHRTHKGNRYYKSEILDFAWKKGYTDTSTVSYKASGYIARYTLKKQLPKEDIQDRYIYLDSNDEIQTRKLEYIRMSNNPAIGLSWIEKYAEQTIRNDYVLDPNGNQCPVPRYYLNYLADYVCLETSEKNKASRIEKARANPDNTPDRRRQKEVCAEAKSQQLIRPYL